MENYEFKFKVYCEPDRYDELKTKIMEALRGVMGHVELDGIKLIKK